MGRHKGFKVSDETKKKISKAAKRENLSAETLLKMSLSHMGLRPNLGKKLPHSEETKIKIGLANSGRIFSEEHKKKLSLVKLGVPRPDISKALTGKIRPLDICLKMSLAKIGEKHPNWKGGITPLNVVVRNSIETKIWRKIVYKRDYWTCQMCKKKKDIKICAHHIKSFSEYPELRYDPNNGITLCRKCHGGVHNTKLIILNNLLKE